MNILKDEYAIVSQEIEAAKAEFSSLGLELAKIAMVSSLATEMSLTATFKLSPIPLSLFLSFFPARNGGNGCMITIIENAEGSKLDAEEYLDMLGNDTLRGTSTYRDQSTNISQFAKDYIQALLAALGSELGPVLDGTVWRETPIDWQGYK